MLNTQNERQDNWPVCVYLIHMSCGWSPWLYANQADLYVNKSSAMLSYYPSFSSASVCDVAMVFFTSYHGGLPVHAVRHNCCAERKPARSLCIWCRLPAVDISPMYCHDIVYMYDKCLIALHASGRMHHTPWRRHHLQYKTRWRMEIRDQYTTAVWFSDRPGRLKNKQLHSFGWTLFLEKSL